MKVSNISEIEISVIRNILTMNKYVLMKENDNELFFPIFRLEIIHSEGLIIVDELGFKREYPDYFEVFIGESMILIYSPDCSRFDMYYTIYELGEIKDTYEEILKKRVIKSIFKQRIDLSELSGESIEFILSLMKELEKINITGEAIENKSINIQMNRIKIEIGFNIWNLENYLGFSNEELEYSLRVKIPDFNLEIEANSLEYLLMMLNEELEVRGVRKW